MLEFFCYIAFWYQFCDVYEKRNSQDDLYPSRYQTKTPINGKIVRIYMCINLTKKKNITQPLPTAVFVIGNWLTIARANVSQISGSGFTSL
jgi:hypothetical protein